LARGFTLLELIVALSVLGLMVGLGAALLHMGLRLQERTSRIAEETEDLEAVQGLLRRELARAHPAAQNFRGKKDDLRFEAPLPLALGGATAEIRIYSKPAAQKNNVVMAWRQTEAPWKEAVLIEGVKAAHFSYYEKATSSDWNEVWQKPRGLPSAIRLTVDFPEGDRRRWPEFTVAPLITADVTCIYDPATKKCWNQ
jgi:general secretion pathway protein J